MAPRRKQPRSVGHCCVRPNERVSGPDYKVEVVPVIAQFRNGYAAPFKMKPDDLSGAGLDRTA